MRAKAGTLTLIKKYYVKAYISYKTYISNVNLQTAFF
jgi:hypothetical protein